MRAASVTAVYVSAVTGQQMVNVDAGGGPDGIPGLVNALPAYYPQNGDRVLIEDIGGGVWVVVGCLTPNRGPLPRMDVEVMNAAPGGWLQSSLIATPPGEFDNPSRMVIVPASSPVPTPTGGTVVTNAASSRSYRYDFGGSWNGDSFRLYQGIYNGFGPWDACWFYPSMTAALSGHTVTGIRIHLRRAGVAGSAGPVQTHLWLHNHASQPVGAPTLTSGPIDPIAAQVSWSGSADVPLPLAWAQAIQAGTAKGIGISGRDQDTYSILLGPDEDGASGQLSIDYS